MRIRPSAADVRAAFAAWEICQGLDGYWTASLTTAPADEPVRMTAPTLAALAAGLNDYLGGSR